MHTGLGGLLGGILGLAGGIVGTAGAAAGGVINAAAGLVGGILWGFGGHGGNWSYPAEDYSFNNHCYSKPFMGGGCHDGDDGHHGRRSTFGEDRQDNEHGHESGHHARFDNDCKSHNDQDDGFHTVETDASYMTAVSGAPHVAPAPFIGGSSSDPFGHGTSGIHDFHAVASDHVNPWNDILHSDISAGANVNAGLASVDAGAGVNFDVSQNGFFDGFPLPDLGVGLNADVDFGLAA